MRRAPVLQRRLGLVVGRVRLEDEPAGRSIHGARLARALGHEVDDLRAAELDARAARRRRPPAATRRRARPRRTRHGAARSCARRSSGAGRLQLLDRLVRTARHRHLGADDVDRARPPARVLRPPGTGGWPRARRSAPPAAGPGRRRRPCWRRDGSWRSPPRRRLRTMVSALAIARVGGLVRHGLGPRWSPPRISRVAGQAARGCDAGDEARKSAGAHAGIAAVLVDLVAGRLDQQRGAVGQRLINAGLEHHRMGGTDRRDAARACRHGWRARISRSGAHRARARKASSSAMVELPSIGPFLPTASAPAALASCSARSTRHAQRQAATKVPPKQSPAPVGSTSSAAKAGVAIRRSAP